MIHQLILLSTCTNIRVAISVIPEISKNELMDITISLIILKFLSNGMSCLFVSFLTKVFYMCSYILSLVTNCSFLVYKLFIIIC